MSNRFSLLLKGSAFRVLQTVVSVAIGFVMMPFLINTLGAELYGVWVVVASLAGTYYLLDMGFSQAVTRYVTEYIHQKKPQKANEIINTALVIYSLLGLLVLAVSCGVSFWGVDSLMEDAKHVELVQILVVLSGIQLMLEFPTKAFPGIISAYLRFDSIAQVRMAKTIIDALLIYLLLTHGYGLMAMALVGFCTSIISTAIYLTLSNRLFKELEYSKNFISANVFKEVFHFSKWLFVFDINKVLRERLDVWAIAYFMGSAMLTSYYVAVRLMDYILRFLTQATGITGPIFTELYAKQQWNTLSNTVRRFVSINIWLSTTVMIGIYACGQDFLQLWIGDEIEINEAAGCLLIIALGRVAAYVAAPMQSLMITYKKHRFGAVVSVMETLLGFILCLWLIPQYGLLGAAISITVPAIIGRLLIVPFYVQTRVHSFISFAMALRVGVYLVVTTISALWLLSFGWWSQDLVAIVLNALLVIGICALTAPLLFPPRDLQKLLSMVFEKIHKLQGKSL